jgi:predicted PurR-regulated permease PerM
MWPPEVGPESPKATWCRSPVRGRDYPRARMASSVLSTRTIVRIVLTVVACGVVLYLLYLVRDVMLLLFLSGFLAVALGPAVGFFHGHGVPRGLSILLVYLGLLLAIVVVGLIVVPPIAREVNSAAHDLPGNVRKLRENKTFRRYDDKYHVSKKLQQQADKLPGRISDAAKALSSVTVGVFSAATKLITVLTMTFFLLFDGERLIAFLLRLRGPTFERRYRALADDIYRSTAGYVAGNLAISVIAGLVTYVSLRVLGIGFAAPLAVLVALLDLIPLIGATIGAIAVGIVTLFYSFPTDTIVWVAIALVYQQVENNLLQPVIYRRTVAVPPLLVIVAILIGGGLLGVLGALVAIPVAAALQILARDVWARHPRRAGASAADVVVSEPGVPLEPA